MRQKRVTNQGMIILRGAKSFELLKYRKCFGPDIPHTGPSQWTHKKPERVGRKGEGLQSVWDASAPASCWSLDKEFKSSQPCSALSCLSSASRSSRPARRLLGEQVSLSCCSVARALPVIYTPSERDRAWHPVCCDKQLSIVNQVTAILFYFRDILLLKKNQTKTQLFLTIVPVLQSLEATVCSMKVFRSKRTRPQAKHRAVSVNQNVLKSRG